ncbi:choline/carnitine/betaine transport [Actinomadura coerulea]|uniref:Choline/carnitine/betaine transport n=1 Tax=Actinomadura coerulea TaxID=46159 RepID=A0A7X0G4L6_9ACTN|nr:BCCT family transporter [Actinomadura coerulea]MBB6399328.1 choline/carnitine/betaine transport [Actinomadura coerulea]GGQ28121.1 choline transporter [Actinomadura coerulea]
MERIGPEPGERDEYPGTEPVSLVKRGRPHTDWIVYGVAAVLSASFVIWGGADTGGLSSVAEAMLDWLLTNLGWLFVLAATGFVIFSLWLAFSRYGRIPLGREGDEPEFRTVSWIAMMFSAGMGIGLMFFGVAEPLTHFVEPPPGTDPPRSEAAIETAMATTMFHWTLHPWSIYAVLGLAIGYSHYRRGRTQLISSAFVPLLGRRRAAGPAGKVIDILALFATLFGSAASLGIGALQIRTGMQEAGWISSLGTTVLVLIIVVLTVCFVVSAVSGVARGIQWLSNINMVLAVVLAVFVFVVGPTVFILELLPTSLGVYIQDFGQMASRSGATGGEPMRTFLSNWTIFYWAWWISWAPFVGMFLARISRGRTIRQFVGGVILVPSAVSVAWFAIFGGTAIDQQRKGLNPFGNGTEEQITFNVLGNLPWVAVTAVVVMVLVAIFFVSGADAASIVMGTLSQRGSTSPSRWVVIFWGAMTGGVAAVMLVIGGDKALNGIQNITFIGALPFAIVLILLCVALAKDVRSDPMMRRQHKGAEVLEDAVIAGVIRHRGEFELQIKPSEPGSAAGDAKDAGQDPPR